MNSDNRILNLLAIIGAFWLAFFLAARMRRLLETIYSTQGIYDYSLIIRNSETGKSEFVPLREFGEWEITGARKMKESYPVGGLEAEPGFDNSYKTAEAADGAKEAGE